MMQSLQQTIFTSLKAFSVRKTILTRVSQVIRKPLAENALLIIATAAKFYRGIGRAPLCQNTF